MVDYDVVIHYFVPLKYIIGIYDFYSFTVHFFN